MKNVEILRAIIIKLQAVHEPKEVRKQSPEISSKIFLADYFHFEVLQRISHNQGSVQLDWVGHLKPSKSKFPTFEKATNLTHFFKSSPIRSKFYRSLIRLAEKILFVAIFGDFKLKIALRWF